MSCPASFAAVVILDSRSVKSDRAQSAIPDAPALANERAVARPMPLEAPVIRT